jgi:tetratricopeptide (TPR) repeat protein
MKSSRTLYHLKAVTVALLLAAMSASGETGKTNGKKIEFSTKSKEAKEYVAQIVHRIESFQFGPDLNVLAKKAVEADPEFAFAHYLVGTTSNSAAEAKPHTDKAVELSKKASEGERRYIEAVLLVRTQKTDEGLAIFRELSKQYPEERMVQMMIGQAAMNSGKLDEAKAALERAIQLDPSTPRAHTFIGNVYLLKGDYAKAREYFKNSLSKAVKDSAPFGPNYGLAYAYVYEGDIKSALKTLEAYQAEYDRSPAQQNFPAVFIWNSIGRLYLESGQPKEALKAYEKGYATIPDSKLSELEKKTWLGRLHHGKGRALAKLGKHEEAWKEADLIKAMIEEGGKEGEQFWPAYHYIAGYLKLEAGDYAKAIEHLKQTDLNDPFHKLLLARAYDKAGDQANAQKLYKEIVSFNIINLERALSYPEAKKKLKS